jgi:hypothetical protein
LRISRAAYHGGDFNGVCCRKIVGNSKAIADSVQVILKEKKKGVAMTRQFTKKFIKSSNY